MNKQKISTDNILRIKELENNIGIDDMNIYAYLTKIFNDKTLIINGEIYSEKITQEFKMNAVAYDKDGDIIISGVNESFGNSGFVTKTIQPRSVNGLIPFRIELEIPDNIEIRQIRVFPG